MSFQTPFICDRRVFDKMGYVKLPNNDIETPIFYYVKEAPTLVSSYQNGKEELKEQMTIVVFGGRPFIGYDYVKLENGKKYTVSPEITYNYVEQNILVKDMLKPRIANMEIILE